jgi:3-methyladenine DNA glycosylase AlkD
MHPLQRDLRALKDPKRAATSQRFFKTGKGEYGEGDQFLGLTVPQVRATLKVHQVSLGLADVDTLLASPWHEERLAGAIALAEMAKRQQQPLGELGSFYVAHIERINNWDLIDVSADKVIGPYLQECLTHEQRVVFINDCLRSPHLWTVRMVVIVSFHQIRQGNEKLTFYVCERLLDHPHDLIHKACGWMLREVGKRCGEDVLRDFLDRCAGQMPRTMLRYAIERFDVQTRQFYLTRR